MSAPGPTPPSAWFSDAGPLAPLAASGRALARLPSGRLVALFYRGAGADPAALDAACYHHGGPLADGAIEDLGGAACVSCPWHRYRLTLARGEALYEALDPATRAVSRASKGVKQRAHVARADARADRVWVCDTGAPPPPGALDAAAAAGGSDALAAALEAALGAEGAALWLDMAAATAAAGGALPSDAYAAQPNNSARWGAPGEPPRAGGAAAGVPLHAARGAPPCAP